MKTILLAAFIMAGANALAQQVPRPAPAPPGAPARTSQSNNEELVELLRAQTTAIKALASKLDSLEQRISTLEKGKP